MHGSCNKPSGVAYVELGHLSRLGLALVRLHLDAFLLMHRCSVPLAKSADLTSKNLGHQLMAENAGSGDLIHLPSGRLFWRRVSWGFRDAKSRERSGLLSGDILEELHE